MPTHSADKLEAIAAALLEAAGASRHEADVVARHCIGANLAGHDSHGVIRIPAYIERVRNEHIVPGARFEIVQESPTTTVIDGNWGFGFVVSERAMEITIEKARISNVAAATVYRQGHVGRVADYPLMAAEAGMISMMTADSGRSPKSVAPFGGRVARLGTNPICMAMPSDLEAPFFLDMATCAAAAGKLELAVSRGESVPEGWLIDADGASTTDPKALKAGGAILPLGGSEGYRGYGLAAMVEILSGLLTGLGFGVEPSGRHNDGCFMAVFNVAAFRPLDEFRRDVTEFAEYLKATPRAESVEEIYYPGEIEHRRATARREDGIFVEDATCERLESLAEEFGLTDKLAMG
ncbi:MAG: Ldh family oxidoreductase [Alphaproteobacteria bacterium]|nr:Ldh family oxidoreductase [Alphaproteobacteria bacterium]